MEASRPGIKGFAAVDQARQEIYGYNPERVSSMLGPFKLPNFKGYFVVPFKKPFSKAATYGINGGDAGATGAYATFNTSDGEVIEARVATSFISLDQARANLKAEFPTWDFDAVQKKLRATWNRKLELVSVEGANEHEVKTVTTALYHAMLYPRIFSEQGQYYSAFDDKVHKGESYNDYSIWDTFRAEHSLLTLVAPERIDGMINALLKDYQEGGWMPKWPNPLLHQHHDRDTCRLDGR